MTERDDDELLRATALENARAVLAARAFLYNVVTAQGEAYQRAQRTA